MPFYEYECSKCGFRDEVLQQISDAPLKKCPNCGKNALRKLMSAPVFRLKGSGWYETDFKSDKENKRNLAGAEKEEAKSETKADAKADTKAEGAKGEGAKGEGAKDGAKSDKPDAGASAAKAGDKPAAKAEDRPASKPASKSASKSAPARTTRRTKQKAAPRKKARR